MKLIDIVLIKSCFSTGSRSPSSCGPHERCTKLMHVSCVNDWPGGPADEIAYDTLHIIILKKLNYDVWGSLKATSGLLATDQPIYARPNVLG